MKISVFCNVCRLDTDYVDLYLIHNPAGGNILRTYDTLFELKAQGLVRFVKWIFCNKDCCHGVLSIVLL